MFNLRPGLNVIRRPALFLAVLFALLLISAVSQQAETPMSSPRPHILDQQLVRFSTMITVRDLERSKAFYQRYFGLSIAEKQDGLVLLHRDNLFLYLVTESPATKDKPGVALTPPGDPSRTSLNLIFRVRDVRAVHRALEADGLRFLAPPHQPSWGGWRCFAQDPDGYLIEIEQP